MEIIRVYAEKKEGYNVAAKALLSDIKNNLSIKGIEKIRIFVRYDISGVTKDQFLKAKYVVFSEPMQDCVYDENIDLTGYVSFATEFLPGQFDQRADSAAQCMQVISGGERPIVKAALVYAFKGQISDSELSEIKNYLINPVEAREADTNKPTTLSDIITEPEDVRIINGFVNLSENELTAMLLEYGFAMDLDDIKFCQNYFKNDEMRDPTITELRMIDTYWSEIGRASCRERV